MYRNYINSILDCRKYEADTGSNGGNSEGEQSEESGEQIEGTDTSQAPDKKERLFSRAQLASIVAKESQKAVKEAMSEAEKLSGLNDVEKATYEKEQLEAKLAEYERKENLSKMADTASEMLTNGNATATKDVLGLLVTEDAETTSANVKAYLKAIELERETIKNDFEKRLGTKEALGGNSSLSLAEGAYGKELAERNKTEKAKNTYFK